LILWNDVAAWETFVHSAEGSWVTSMIGQEASDEAPGDAQDLADKRSIGTRAQVVAMISSSV